MIFHHLTASFGNLERAHLELKDGLNLIEAPNESGKSTLCAFLRAMFYGVNTRERDTKTALAEKNRYQPWSGAPMEGELTLTSQGRTLTLRRSSKAAPFDTWTVTDAVGEPVSGLGQQPGPALLSVGREVYERSAFLQQGPFLPLGGSVELEKRIAALVSSGEEGISYSQADSTLREWLRRRKHNKAGLIPRLEGELQELDQQLARLSEYSRRIADASAREAELSRQLNDAKSDLSVHDQLDRQEQNRRYARYHAAWQSAVEETDALKEKLSSLGPVPESSVLRAALSDLGELEGLETQARAAEAAAKEAQISAQTARSSAGMFCFLGMTPEEAWQRADADAAEADEHGAAASRSSRAALAGALTGLAAGGALAAVLTAFSVLSLPLSAAVGGGVFVLIALIFLLSSLHRRAAHLEEQDALLEQYDAAHSGEIRARAADYRERCARAEEAETAASALLDKAQALRARCTALQNRIFPLVCAFAPDVSSPAAARSAIEGLLALQKSLSDAEENRDSARRIFDLVAEQGGSEAATLELLHPPSRSREELNALLPRLELSLQQVRQSLSSARGALAALGDPAALAAQREQTEAELSRRRQEYDAITLALHALEEANAAFRARISPELNRRASQLFSLLTGGAYDSVLLARTFEAQARPTGALQPRSTLSLSQGTADQLYLAVRLALCSLVLPEEDPIPLVLDDVLCNFDDERMALALQALLDLAQNRQILLFTCHSRERQWLSARHAPCTFLQMGI